VSKYGPLKRGDAKGEMVFWTYRKDKEIWVTKEKFNAYREKIKSYDATAKSHFKRRDHPPLFHQDPITLLYYLGRSNHKERWVDHNTMKHEKSRRQEARTKYNQKTMQYKKTTLKIGDQHPEENGSYVIKKYYNRLVYGTKEQLEKIVIYNREKDRLKARKYRILKKKRMSFAEKKYEKGNEKEGLIFYRYKSTGKEIWLSKAEYDKQLELDKNRPTYQNRRDILSSPGTNATK
jgi:hypothetical protein